MYINIHTHHPYADSKHLEIPNVIVSKDYLTQTPCCAGIHPWYIDENFEKQFEALKIYVAKEGVIAVGECGLDKMKGPSLERQKMAFERQIELAIEVQKPLVIHCVRSYSEVLTSLMRLKTDVPVVFHGFAKNWELAKSLLHHGYYLSLGPLILKGQHEELVQNIPLDRLFLETDDKQVKISDIYAYFCHARKVDKKELEEQITKNFTEVFNYSL